MSNHSSPQNSHGVTETVHKINQLIKNQGLCIWDPNLGAVRSCFELEGAAQVGDSIYINLVKTSEVSTDLLERFNIS